MQEWQRELHPQEVRLMESIMGREEVEAITFRYEALSSLVPLAPISNETEYEKAAAMMERLLDAGGEQTLVYTLVY